MGWPPFLNFGSRSDEWESVKRGANMELNPVHMVRSLMCYTWGYCSSPFLSMFWITNRVNLRLRVKSEILVLSTWSSLLTLEDIDYKHMVWGCGYCHSETCGVNTDSLLATPLCLLKELPVRVTVAIWVRTARCPCYSAVTMDRTPPVAPPVSIMAHAPGL